MREFAVEATGDDQQEVDGDLTADGG